MMETTTQRHFTHTRVNMPTTELATLLLWQSTRESRPSTISAGIIACIRNYMQLALTSEPSFVPFTSQHEAAQFLAEYATRQRDATLSNLGRNFAPSKAMPQQPLSAQEMADIEEVAKQVDAMQFTKPPTQASRAPVASEDDEPLSDEDLRRLGADGMLRPYASCIEPPPPDVATSHETYDAGATRGTVSDV